MEKVGKKLLIGIGALLAFALAAPADTWAQCSHGASIFKSCSGPKPSCGDDADCPDTECTDGVCDSPGGAFVDCLITLGHADTCGDTTKITEGFDIDAFGTANTRVPAVGNLPISGIGGNAVCCPGPLLPCFVGPAGSVAVFASGSCGNLALPGLGVAGSVTFHNNQYNIQPGDPDPLPNQGNVKVQDQCDMGAGGCSTGISTVQFTASTDLVSGCSSTPKQASTPCGDIDNNVCTIAGCDGLGACDQMHITPDSTPCPDMGNECAAAGCNGAGACDQLHVPVPPSTPCADTDNNVCTIAGCNGQGACNQMHITPDSTPCPDTGNECAAAGCNGAGACDQLHVPAQDSTPCTDTGNECAAAGCNGLGSCDQLHVPTPDSTPCTDTDGDVCTLAGCNGLGTCDQMHVTDPDPDCDRDNHYKCYKLRPIPFAQRTVTLVDQFGSATVPVIKPTNFCNPANKNGEGIADPTAHLMCYQIRQSGFAKRDVLVRNQFGDQTVTVVKPESLCNPAEKNGVPFGSPGGAFLNHFKCYRVRGKGFTTRTVTLEDQFEERTETVVKPRLLCNPVDKNGEGIPNPTQHITCYTLKSAPFTPRPVSVVDQFGEQGGQPVSGECRKRSLICVPSIKNPASPSGAFLDEGGGDLLG